MKSICDFLKALLIEARQTGHFANDRGNASDKSWRVSLCSNLSKVYDKSNGKKRNMNRILSQHSGTPSPPSDIAGFILNATCNSSSVLVIVAHRDKPKEPNYSSAMNGCNPREDILCMSRCESLQCHPAS
jgi:hypothetical protein